jgi:hypothetical protein
MESAPEEWVWQASRRRDPAVRKQVMSWLSRQPALDQKWEVVVTDAVRSRYPALQSTEVDFATCSREFTRRLAGPLACPRRRHRPADRRSAALTNPARSASERAGDRQASSRATRGGPTTPSSATGCPGVVRERCKCSLAIAVPAEQETRPDWPGPALPKVRICCRMLRNVASVRRPPFRSPGWAQKRPNLSHGVASRRIRQTRPSRGRPTAMPEKHPSPNSAPSPRSLWRGVPEGRGEAPGPPTDRTRPRCRPLSIWDGGCPLGGCPGAPWACGVRRGVRRG